MPKWTVTLHTAAGRPILAQEGRGGRILPSPAGEITLLAWEALGAGEELLIPHSQALFPDRLELCFTHPGPEEAVRRLLATLQRESAAGYHGLSASNYRSVLWKRRCSLVGGE